MATGLRRDLRLRVRLPRWNHVHLHCWHLGRRHDRAPLEDKQLDLDLDLDFDLNLDDRAPLEDRQLDLCVRGQS